jgi:hypothetical protein
MARSVAVRHILGSMIGYLIIAQSAAQAQEVQVLARILYDGQAVHFECQEGASEPNVPVTCDRTADDLDFFSSMTDSASAASMALNANASLSQKSLHALRGSVPRAAVGASALVIDQITITGGTGFAMLRVTGRLSGSTLGTDFGTANVSPPTGYGYVGYHITIPGFTGDCFLRDFGDCVAVFAVPYDQSLPLRQELTASAVAEFSIGGDNGIDFSVEESADATAEIVSIEVLDSTGDVNPRINVKPAATVASPRSRVLVGRELAR